MLQFAPATTTEQQEAGLPALVDRAARALAGARTSAEVLEARVFAGLAYDASKRAARLMQAKNAHDSLIAAAHRAQADALLIESQAKRRLADEYDAAQERGEVRGNGERSFSEAEKVGFSELGLKGKDIYEARQIRDAEAAAPGISERAVQAMLDRREEPTRAKLKREIAPYVELRGSADMAKAEAAADEREFRKFKKTWKAMRPGARELCLAWLKA